MSSPSGITSDSALKTVAKKGSLKLFEEEGVWRLFPGKTIRPDPTPSLLEEPSVKITMSLGLTCLK